MPLEVFVCEKATAANQTTVTFPDGVSRTYTHELGTVGALAVNDVPIVGYDPIAQGDVILLGKRTTAAATEE